MKSDYYQWNAADWREFFIDDGYSPREARDLAEMAVQWHAEAMESGGEGPDDTDPRYFWVGYAC